MAFLETPRFSDKISYGSSGGPIFKTNVIETYSGHEERNEDWSAPRYTYDVKEGVKNIEDMYEIYEYFLSVSGRLNGFRFKDWLDFKSSASSTADVSAIYQSLGTGTSTTTEFPLNKIYTKGALTFTRRIFKPVSNTVVVIQDGSVLVEGSTANYWVNTVSGIVNMVSAPASGSILTCGYEFDIPVRFSDDQLMATHDFYNIMNTSIFLIELRAPA